MAYIYLNDGGPESEDYDSNYFYFNENNPQAVALIEKMLSSHVERDQAFRVQLQEICQNSHIDQKESKNKAWLKNSSRLIKNFLFRNKFKQITN